MLEMSNQSDMNMAILTLYRINESLYNCNVHQRERNYKSWFYEMMVLMGEASASMSGDMDNITKSKEELNKIESSKTKDKDDFIKAKLLIEEIEPLVNGIGVKTMDYQALYMKLFYLGIYIKNILKKGGVLMKMKADSHFAL